MADLLCSNDDNDYAQDATAGFGGLDGLKWSDVSDGEPLFAQQHAYCIDDEAHAAIPITG